MALLFGLTGTVFGICCGYQSGPLGMVLALLMIGGLGLAVGMFIDAKIAHSDSEESRADLNDPNNPDLTEPVTPDRFGGPLSIDLRAQHYFGGHQKH
jgi:uncharacterized membrane protein